MGVAVWPMTDLEADDALASAAHLASQDARVEQVRIWTVDKDLAQCVRDNHVVQVDRRAGVVRDANGVKDKFGVTPELIPDYLALVGDAADGFPGIRGIGAVTAARLLNAHGPIDTLPERALDAEQRQQALLFRTLAMLRTDAPLFASVDEIAWRGPTERFAKCVARLGDQRLLERTRKAAGR
jgi:5'-3' exonuclease